MLTIHFESENLSLDQVAARRKLRDLAKFEEVALAIEVGGLPNSNFSVGDLKMVYTQVLGFSHEDRHSQRETLQVVMDATPSSW